MNTIQTYANPVYPGFHPDPSVIRVGNDFYLVNSTFHYYPGIVISHSRDLVHWRPIGHVWTRSDWLDIRGLMDGRGFWAPDISYYNGLFYIFVTLRLNEIQQDGSPSSLIRRQMVVTSPNPEGPYSYPRFIDVDGIDPSHFVDEDGKHYMLLNPGVRIIPLTDDCSTVTGEIKTIWEGSGGRIPEGPHLFKKDGWYYILTAEGGTGYGHQIGSGRSRSLYGPYESNPHNPILKQNDPESPLQRCGHGKFVEAPDGSWWVLYLCGRPVSAHPVNLEADRFCILGRETALDPVQWTDDGWPIINEKKGPSLVNRAPNLPWSPFPEKNRDDFEAAHLDIRWYTPRNPDFSAYSLTERPGYLRLYCRSANLNELTAHPLLQRETSLVSEATCLMEFNPQSPGEEAGLTLYYDTKTHIKFGRRRKGDSWYLFVEDQRGTGYIPVAERPEYPIPERVPGQESLTIPQGNTNKTVPSSQLYLRILTRALERHFLYSYDGLHWEELVTISDCYHLSDEGYQGPHSKRFTGTMVGIFAYNGGSCSTTPADFDWFEYIPQEK
ncbi:glycoside hydrolase family 43 protein [Treponema sp. J25]|uniref:glycoside hydrolase family 43 protein n=1 Tax=Treponema sp. J25 TaxID=2094121 RepID=UPI001049D6F6|nr:glycoside hydrolase family 43 protein [Treponema sp. J25]TCW60358.1 glycoside hydrolase family 43 protein [Treponema sp. J25]